MDISSDQRSSGNLITYRRLVHGQEEEVSDKHFNAARHGGLASRLRVDHCERGKLRNLVLSHIDCSGDWKRQQDVISLSIVDVSGSTTKIRRGKGVTSAGGQEPSRSFKLNLDK